MAIPGIPSRGIRVDSLAWPVAPLVDVVLACYGEWRAMADAVGDAYRGWADAPPDERAWRFVTYTATLDQEEAAAGAYAQSIAELERRLWPSVAKHA